MSTKVLLVSGVLLLLLLATFATATVTQNEDLVFDPDIKTLNERHRQNSLPHRIKRGIWDYFGQDDMEESSNSTLETSAEFDDQETGQDQEFFPSIDGDDADDQQDYNYIPKNSENQTSSQERKPRQSGEDLDDNEYTNTAGDHEYYEDYDGLGQIDHEGSAAEPDFDTPHISSFQEGPFDAEEPISIPRPGLEPGSDTPSYFYRVTTIISAPYRESLVNRSSPQFRKLGDQLSQAIDALYKRDLPNHRTRAKILKFLQTSDPVATQVSLDIESTSPAEEKIRSIFADQLQLHTLGNIQARPDGFSFRNMQDPRERECNPETEFSCQSDGECLPISARCDGILQCIDESDEANCTAPDTTTITEAPTVGEPPRLHTYPRKKELTEGSIKEVRFSCIDEGQLGARVRWSREDGTALPPGSTDNDGVLTIPDVRAEHSGNYVCEAFELPANNPGRNITAMLIVKQKKCLLDQFRCSSGQCISLESICDQSADCHDGSDESNCENCGDQEFQCASGECIDKNLCCNNIADCTDNSDELRCSEKQCPRDEFRCEDGTCLSGSSRCNFIRECPNGEDEDQCACPVGKWQCLSGVCIDEKFRCDRTDDCIDRSDEANCDFTTSRPICLSGEFECSDGVCIPGSARCDGISNCRDAGDELNCTRVGELPRLHTYPRKKELTEGSIKEVQFSCVDEGQLGARVRWSREDGTALPPGSTDNDGVLTIPDVRAEYSGDYVCEAFELPANTPGRNITAMLIVKQKEEVPTSSPAPRPCESDEATCSNGECISKSKVYGGRYDCTNGTDEIRCNKISCEPNQFRCASNDCVSKARRCDGDPDCRDGSDEENCEPPTPGSPCKHDEYQCASNDQCIPKSFHCDKERDCIDESDEIGCIKVEILKPPQRMVTLNVGETFTISCTALGFPVPEISWHWNCGHIPARCTTISVNGTGILTCPSITIADQGAYTCEAMNNLVWVIAQPDAILKVNTSSIDVCPPGYTGTSCETCATGYYRDPTDTSHSFLGACSICPCNGNEQECKVDGLGGVKCYCLPGFNGLDCSERANSVPTPAPTLPIIDPAEWIGGPTDTIRLICTAPQGARITWTRSENVSLPVSAIEQNGILTIYNPSLSDAGYYICTAITYEGVETRSTARVTIQSPPAGHPSVRVEPEWREAFQGSLAEVKCIVTGDPTPVVTWTKRGNPLPAHIQTEGNTLKIIDPQVSDQGVYVCHATNSRGSAQGITVIDVTRREMPVLELYPQQEHVVRINDSTLLQCRVTKGIPTPSVSWAREDGRPFSSNVQQLPDGVLRLNHVTPEDGGSFTCSASNEVGSVSLVAIIEISTPPEITILPLNDKPLSVRRGERVRLTCTASGQPKPSVEWKKNKNGIPGETIVPKLQSSMAIYEISSVSYNDEGSYTCVATNAYGLVSDRIQIRVEDDQAESNTSIPISNSNGSSPRVTTPEERLRIPDGGRVKMPCQVHGNDQVAIYLDWRRNDGRNLTQQSTVRGGILLIPAVTKDDAGIYLCQGLNTNGNVLSTAATYLEVISPPRIELDPIRQVVRPGESPSVICRAKGDQPIEIKWYVIDQPLSCAVTQDGGSLQFDGITAADVGKYVCKATSNAGTAEAVVQVSINEDNELSISTNQRDIDTFVGNSVRLECPADSRSTITWSRYRGDLPRNSNRRGNILELTKVKSEDSGRYICRITTQNGASSTDYIDLRVEPQKEPVTVRTQFRAANNLVNIGDSFDVWCDVTGVHDARFRWIRPDEPWLPQNAEDLGTVLRFRNVAMVDSGIYRCIVDTPEGSFEKDFELEIQGGKNDAPAVVTKLAPYGTGVVMDCTANIEPPIKFQWHKLGGHLSVNSRTSDNRLELLEVKAEDAGTYICQANNGRVNIEMPQVLVVTGVVPYFNQAPTSYMSFLPIPDASLQFQIEVLFKPENYDGIILYNGQYGDGTGDFILLSLVGGYAEFRFNLGSSPAVIRGNRPITLGVWHTIKLQRDHKHGTMFVDGDGPYSEIAGGSFQTLDLSEPLYIGGVPDYIAISQQVDVNSGFVGCISKVVIGNTQLDLTDDHLVSIGITTCETCAENPCSNNGLCQEAATENGYTCLCPAGYSGKNCTNIGQACSPDICGEGTCVDRDEGFVCSCPVDKGGSRCEFDVHVIEPAFHDRGAYLANQTLKVHRKPGKRYTPKKTGSELRSRASIRKDRSRKHPNHYAMHNTKKH